MNVRVYNKSLLPIVWRNDWRGKMVIQPGKCNEIGENMAALVVKKFPGACFQKEFEEHIASKKKSVSTSEKSKE